MLVPGVSGGSMAMILGIYQELISAVSSFRKQKKSNYMSIITQFGMPVQFYQKCKFQFGKNIKGLKTDNNGFAEIEDIIYFCIRCGLIHETCVSPSLIFSNDLIFTYHDGIMFLPKTLILGLIEAVEVFRRDEDNT